MDSLIIRTPGRRKAAAIILLVVGWILLAWFIGVIVPASAQDETEAIGKLVLVPDDLYVGETTMALGFHLDFPDRAITIEYTRHFVPAGEECDTAEAGTASFTATPARLSLTACTLGEGSVQLTETDTGLVIAEATATISEHEISTRAIQQKCVNLIGVPCPTPGPPQDLDALVLGQRDIAVTWSRLSGTTKYQLDAGNLGTFELTGTGKSFMVDAGSTHSFKVRAYGDGGTYTADWGSWAGPVTVTTESPPTITISADSSPRTEGQSVSFTLTASHAPSFIGFPINIDVDETGDFLTSSPTSIVRLSKNSTTVNLSMSTTNDSTCEDDGSVTVTIEPATGYYTYNIGNPSSDAVTIEDEQTDCIITVTFSSATYSATEGTSEPIRVELDMAPRRQVDIEVDVNPGQDVTLSFSKTSTSRTFNYNQHDTDCNDETVTLTFSNLPDGIVQGSTSSATIDVDDDDEPPAQPSNVSTTTGDGTITLDWDDVPHAAQYVVKQEDDNGVFRTLPFGLFSIRFSGSKATISGLTNTESYKHHIISQGCIRSLPTLTETDLPLAAPRQLDIIPRQERKAKLTWTYPSHNPSGTEYHFELQATPGPGVSIATRRENLSLTSQEFEIELDDVMDSGTPKGLGDDPYSYDIHFEAEVWVGLSPFTNQSETITIIDSPIVSINGDSSTRSGNTGEVVVKWNIPADVTGYTLRWRKLGGIHSNPTWELNSGTYPSSFTDGVYINDTDLDSWKIPSIPDSGVEDVPLEIEKVYAFQLNYTTSTGKVFSARDRFAWPSARTAGNGERVASFPLNYLRPDNTYSYVVCEDTFPAANVSEWKEFIHHAFSQWELVAGDLITVEQLDQDCADYEQFVQEILDQVNAYLSMQSSTPSWAEIQAKVISFIDNLDENDIEATKNDDRLLNEVLMIEHENFPGVPDAAAVFQELSGLVGGEYCPTACVFDPYIGKDDVGNPIITNDILLHDDIFDVDPLDFPGADRVPSDDDVRFNSCEGGNTPYFGLLHESGHILGVGGAADVMGGTAHGHPQITDSVMSYSVDRKFACSPTPWDIMIMYAMYQVD